MKRSKNGERYRLGEAEFSSTPSDFLRPQHLNDPGVAEDVLGAITAVKKGVKKCRLRQFTLQLPHWLRAEYNSTSCPPSSE